MERSKMIQEFITERVEQLSEVDRDFFEERAGIIQYDALFTREQSELIALILTMERAK